MVKGLALFMAFLLLGSFAWAQTPAPLLPAPVSPLTTLDDIIDALRELQKLVEALSAKLDDVIGKFAQFQTQTEQNIAVLQAKDASLENMDANLQDQVNNISFKIDRSNIYEVVDNNASSFDAYCESKDDILLFGYCKDPYVITTGAGGDVQQFTVVKDDFSDGDYTQNPTWLGNPNYNGWSVTEGKLTLNGSGNTNVLLYTPVPMAYQVFPDDSQEYTEWDFNAGAIGVTNKRVEWDFAVNSPINGTQTGYSIWVTLNVGMQLMKQSPTPDTGPLITLIDSGINPQSGVTYNHKIIRKQNGVWEWYVNGLLVGTATNDYFNSMSYFAIFNQDTDKAFIDDINAIQHVQKPSGVWNVNDLNAPLGIHCSGPASARVVCLRQTG